MGAAVSTFARRRKRVWGPVSATFVFGEPCKASVCALPFACSPFKSGQRSFKKPEEKKAEPGSTDAMSSFSPKPTGTGEPTAETQMREKMSDPCPKPLAFLLVCYLPLCAYLPLPPVCSCLPPLPVSSDRATAA